MCIRDSFSWCPEVIDNTLEVAAKCDYELDWTHMYLSLIHIFRASSQYQIIKEYLGCETAVGPWAFCIKPIGPGLALQK